MRSHEPYRTAYRRAIYLVRDVRDVAISFRTLRASLGFNDADLDKYLSRFVSGHIAGYGSWQDHVNGWLTAADSNPNILVVRYEDLVDDTVARLGEMAAFLKFSCDDGRLRQVIENNRPDHMRSRATDYSDERMAATVGDGTYARWKEHYSPHQLDIFTPTSQVITLAGYR